MKPVQMVVSALGFLTVSALAPSQAHAKNPICYLTDDVVKTVTINRSQANWGDGFIQLRLFDNGASTGAYYGGGQGNKAMLGLTCFDGLRLGEFDGFSFDAQVPNSSPINRGVYLNFIFDLNCDKLNPEYGIIVVDSVLSATGAQGQWHTYSISAEDAIFKSVGGVGGLPSHLSNTGAPLSTLTTAYPDACLVNADPFDNGMKRHTRLPSILMVLGDSNTTTASHIRLDNFNVAAGADSAYYDLESQ